MNRTITPLILKHEKSFYLQALTSVINIIACKKRENIIEYYEYSSKNKC